LKESGVGIIDHTTIEGMKRTKQGVELYLSDDSQLDSDVLVLCLGVKPRISCLSDSGIEVNEGVLADQSMRTNFPEIFVAGDAAQVVEFFSSEKGVNPILPCAIEQGKVAGANMAGESIQYQGWIPVNLLRFFGNMVFSVGMLNPSGKDTETFVKENEKEYKKLVMKDNRLVKAEFINIRVQPGTILQIIKERIDISENRDALFKDPEGVAPYIVHEYEGQQRLGKR